MDVQVSGIIPAHNEGKTVAGVILAAINDVDEVIVVDSCSTDDTAIRAEEAGARVVRVNETGKHCAIRTGIMAARGKELVFLDADLVNPSPGIARDLIAGLRQKPQVTISKGYYDQDTDYGRVTEICARPLISLLFPQLSFVRQPLSGEFAVRLEDILDMPFALGFAVDLGILFHCAAKGEVVQVDLGTKIHKHRSVLELGKAAVEVAATIFRKAGLEFSETVLEQYVEKSVIRSRFNLKPLPPLKDGFHE
jgi:glucosyl-3-phosphoglycerate synthase